MEAQGLGRQPDPTNTIIPASPLPEIVVDGQEKGGPESLAVLAGGIAHDFNNLLAAVLGNIELLLEVPDLDRSRARRRLEDARQACLRGKMLAGQLLTVSRGGAPVRRPLALVPFLMETIRLSLPTSPVRWGLRCQDQPWIVLADESQLGQVVQNLVVNACQWQPTDPQIEVAVSNRVLQAHEHPVLAAGSFVQVDFQDRGPGIAQAIRGRIFDTYFSTRTDGSGLGLAICRSILIHHGGFIECVESTTGAHFRVLLPAVDVSAADAAPPKPPIARPRMSRRILVMDDEPAMREMVQDILESQGCEVVTAGDGKDAAKCWLSARSAGRPFDLALLDLTVTSGWGGLEASRRILLEDPSARLVICSGYADDPVVLAAADQGFRGSLSKPFRMAELLEMVDRVLSA